MPNEKEGKAVYEKAGKSLRLSLPKILINIGVIVLLWFFGSALVASIPTCPSCQPWFNIQTILTGIMLFVSLVLVLQMLRDLRTFSNACADICAYEASYRTTHSMGDVAHYRTIFNGLIGAVILLVMYLLFSAPLWAFNYVVATVVVLGIAVWIFISLYRLRHAMKSIVESYVEAWVKKLPGGPT